VIILPPGRKYLSPKEAKEQSKTEILECLSSNPEGLRFKEIKTDTGFHQTTVSNNLKELIIDNQVEHDPITKLYRISPEGEVFYETRQLIDFIEGSSAMILGTKGAGSLTPAEDLILKSTTAYAYPALNPSFLGYLKQDLNKLYFFQLLSRLAKKKRIDSGYLDGELDLGGLVGQLEKVLSPGKQVLVFTVDHDVLREHMNIEYLHDVLAQKEKDNK
jgi:hypothetical protein